MNKPSKNGLAMIASLNLTGLSPVYVVDIWSKYENGIHESIKRHGKRFTLELYKDCYIFLRNYLLKLSSKPISFCKVDSSGIPKPLWPLRPLIRRCRSSQRVALTIARSYELIRLGVDYSVCSTITDPLPINTQESVREVDQAFKIFLTGFTQKFPQYLGSLQSPIQPWSRVLTTLSKGPNGPAVMTSHLDAKAVTKDPVLRAALHDLNSALQQTWITSWMEQQAKSIADNDSYQTGRLGFSSEPGGKTRVFAIGDYWSQLSLKCIQHSLYDTLKAIPTDATKDQDKGFKTLIKESLGRSTYCFDLSSASDRIPAIMQKHRLELMGGSLLADSWYRVMTKRVFYIKGLKKHVRWEVGQPLGLLSSFPSFALWHHDIIQFAANQERIKQGKPYKFFRDYRLLGDDVVIFNTEVARCYQSLLSKIGVKINLTKSVLGNARDNQIEFAKRLSLRGQEMSSIKHNILSKNDTLSILDLVELLHERDFISPDTGHHGLHRILKSKDLLRLNYMLWLRSSVAPSLVISRGNATLTINRDDILQKIISKRSKIIIDKATKVKPLDMETMFPKLKKAFTSIGVSYDETTLADRSIGDLSNSHPIVLSLTQTSRELQFLMFTVLDDLIPDTVSPIEYLPVVNLGSYHHDRKTVTRYFSKLLLECLDEALDEKNTN